VIDENDDYEVQIRRWWYPSWIQCNYYDMVNAFSTITEAENWIYNGRPKLKLKGKTVVKYL